jgi:sigma-B regulation protein RsbU (phosphoserine phosphatase)
MLSVEEATVNIINYSYPKGSFGMIDIDITGIRSTQDSEGEFSITMSDKGAPFDPTACEEVDVRENVEERQVGGLGIYLYQKLMDEVCYERTADGRNVLKMIKKIPPIIL